SKAGAAEAEPIDLTPSDTDVGADLGSEHTLGTDGVSISAELEATNLITASALIFNTPFAWANFLTEAPAGNIEVTSGALTGLAGKLGVGLAKLDPISKALPVDIGFTGAIGVNYFNHDVEATVGPTAHIRSSSNIEVAAGIEQYSQLYVTAGAYKNP